MSSETESGEVAFFLDKDGHEYVGFGSFDAVEYDRQVAVDARS